MQQFLAVFAIIAVVSAQECGKFGGNVDEKSLNLPWIVQLHERSTNDLLCMGTLVSNQHVLIGRSSGEWFSDLRLKICLFYEWFLFLLAQPLIVCSPNLTITASWTQQIFKSPSESAARISIWRMSRFTPNGSSIRTNMTPMSPLWHYSIQSKLCPFACLPVDQVTSLFRMAFS